jgi:hypothetical protein
MFGLALVVLGAGILIYNRKWAGNVRAGPLRVTTAQLRDLCHPDDLGTDWVSFTADEVLDIDPFDVIRGRGQSLRAPGSGPYLLLRVQYRWILARAPKGHVGNNFTGYLTVFRRGKDDHARLIVSKYWSKYDLVEVQLNAASGYRSWFIVVMIAVGAVSLLGGALAGIGARGIWMKWRLPDRDAAEYAEHLLRRKDVLRTLDDLHREPGGTTA